MGGLTSGCGCAGVEKEGAGDVPSAGKGAGAVCDCWLEFPNVDVLPKGGTGAPEPNPPNGAGLSNFGAGKDGAAAVELDEPSWPKSGACLIVDSWISGLDPKILVGVEVPKPPGPCGVPKNDSVPGLPKGDTLVPCPKPGVKEEAVASRAEPNLDGAAALVAGPSSGTNRLSSSSSA